MNQPNEQIPQPLKLPFRWLQGEHMMVVGDTGTGKTTLVAKLLADKEWIVSLRSKDDNVGLPGKLIKKADAIDDVKHHRFVLFPKYEEQRQQFALAFDRVYKEGGWYLYIDELHGVSQLGGAMKWHIERLLTQGRSLGITVITGLQRPVQVSRFALSQSTHLLSFRQEGRDVKTLVEATTPRIKEALSELDRYEFLWYYRPERTWWKGRLRDLLA